MLKKSKVIEPRNNSISFDDAKKFKIKVELTGDMICILQNFMINTLTDKKFFEQLIFATNGEGVKETIDFVTDLQAKMLEFMGIDVNDEDKMTIGEIHGINS